MFFIFLFIDFDFPRLPMLPLRADPGLIILGIILDLGGGPDHDRLGFRYWKNPGPFVQFDGIKGAKGRFLGFSKVFTQAAFSYIGTEIVAVSDGCASLIILASNVLMRCSCP
jgi:amino acid transporter